MTQQKFDQIYVVLHEVKHTDDTKTIVGNGCIYRPDRSTVEKKMRKLESNLSIKLNDQGQWVKSFYRWQSGHVQEPIPSELQPRVVDNVPIGGFYIDGPTRHYSTTWWMIRDPRGFTFEINGDKFHDLIKNATIDKGLILEDCTWSFGKSGVGSPTLVPFTHDYKEI